ncbi:hypothetical protein Tco_0325833 [Tanacetum coccineum]
MSGDVEKSTGKGSDNTDEAANVLSTLEAANVLSSRSFPTATPAGVATTSEFFPLLQFLPLPVLQHLIQEGQELQEELLLNLLTVKP